MSFRNWSRGCYQIPLGVQLNRANSLLRQGPEGHGFSHAAKAALKSPYRAAAGRSEGGAATTELLSLVAAKWVATSTSLSPVMPGATWAARRKTIGSLRLRLHSGLQQNSRGLWPVFCGILRLCSGLKPCPSGPRHSRESTHHEREFDDTP